MEEAVHNAFVLEWNEVCVSVDRIANVEELKEVIMMRVWQVRNIDQHEADGKILQMSRNEAVETNVQFPIMTCVKRADLRQKKAVHVTVQNSIYMVVVGKMLTLDRIKLNM